MKTFPAHLIRTAMETIGHGAEAIKETYAETHRPGFALICDTSFAIVVAEIANTIVRQADSDDNSHTYLMGQLVDLVDEMRETLGGYSFPGWELTYQY